MAKTCKVLFQPGDTSVSVPPGTTILAAAHKAGVFINSLCGGDGVCGRCRVTVLEGRAVGGSTEFFTREEIRQGYILACEGRIETDLVVDILDVLETNCSHSPPEVTVEYRVCNRGDVRVGPGVNIAFFVDGTLDSVGQTSQTLNPGECEVLAQVVEVPAAPNDYDLEIVVDDDGTGVGANRECDETNNRDAMTDLVCESIG